MRKPDELHARDREWGALVDFVGDPSAGATLGLVHGRRRQGKTLMLELLAEATGGFMFTAREQSDRQNLRELSSAYARHAGLPASLAFDSWLDVIEALLGLGVPLRGRATLELVLQPFWYREAASFWELTDDPELAFRVHALLGGTPAYRAMAFGSPSSRESFDRWVAQRLLNPSSALFREGSLLLREESGVTDTAPYHGVLTAIAARRSEIAGRIGRPGTANRSSTGWVAADWFGRPPRGCIPGTERDLPAY